MKKFKGAVLPLILVTLWWIVAELYLVNAYILPHPAKVMKTAIELALSGVLMEHLTASFGRVFLGFAITFLIAFPAAVLAGASRNVYAYLKPFFEFVRHIPPIAMIPLLILWFGIGETSKIAIIVLASFFPIFINTLSGIITCDKKLIEVGKVFNFSKWELFSKIILPQAFPSIIAGMQLGLGYSWRSLMGAELIAASSGIGYMIIEAEQLSRIDIILVGIMVIGMAGLCIDYLFFKLTDRLTGWEANHERNFCDTDYEPVKEI